MEFFLLSTSHKETTATPAKLLWLKNHFPPGTWQNKSFTGASHQVTIGWPNRQGISLAATSSAANHSLPNPPHLSSCCWLHKSFAWASVTWREGPRLACIGRWLPVSWLCGLTLPKPRFVFTYQEVWTTCIKNYVLLDSCSLITSHKIWASSSHTTCLNKQRDIISFACFLASPHYCDKQPTTGKVQKTTTCNHGLLGHHHPWHEQVDPLPGQPDHESPTKKCNARKQKYSRQALEKTHTHLGQRFFSAAEELNCFPPAATSFWTWKILIQKPHEYRDWMVFQVKQDLCMQKRKLQ